MLYDGENFVEIQRNSKSADSDIMTHPPHEAEPEISPEEAEFNRKLGIIIFSIWVFFVIVCALCKKSDQGAPGASTSNNMIQPGVSPSHLAFANQPADPQAPAFQNQMNFPNQSTPDQNGGYTAYQSQFTGQQTFQPPPPPPPPGFEPSPPVFKPPSG